MPINLRGVGQVADGSITEAKLANDAVTEAKIATNAVTETKIASDAVSANKLTADVASTHFLGYEGSLSHTGMTETSIADFHFVKDTSTTGEAWASISFSAMIQSSSAGNDSQLRLRLDGTDFTSAITTNSTTPEKSSILLEDISFLSNGNHLLEVMADNSIAGGVTTVSQLEIYLSKKAA